MREKIPFDIDLRRLIGQRVYRKDLTFVVSSVRMTSLAIYLHPRSFDIDPVGYTLRNGLAADNVFGWEWDVEEKGEV